MRRPVLETGKASKTVFLSQAGDKITPDEAAQAIQRHVGQMTAELGKAGKIVTSIRKTVVGWGDVKILMTWAVLGEKQTKKARRRATGAEKAGAARHDSVQTASKEGTVPAERPG